MDEKLIEELRNDWDDDINFRANLAKVITKVRAHDATHAAWCKRAEEAEKENTDLKVELEILKLQKPVAYWQKQFEEAQAEIDSLKVQVKELKRSLLKANDELDDWHDSYKNSMGEPCKDDDQEHCTCVPFLRRRIQELETIRDSARQEYMDLTKTHAELVKRAFKAESRLAAGFEVEIERGTNIQGFLYLNILAFDRCRLPKGLCQDLKPGETRKARLIPDEREEEDG